MMQISQLTASKPLSVCAPGCNHFHTVADFARRVGQSESTIRRWLRKGMPRSERTKRIHCSTARRWIADQQPEIDGD